SSKSRRPLFPYTTLFRSIGVVFISQPLLTELDMRLRTHMSTLSYTYLDALLGLVPARTHSAERALRREHESLLSDWARASLAFRSEEHTSELQSRVDLVC